MAATPWLDSTCAGATYEGVARFNGDTFATFNKTNLPGLRRDTILSFLKARDGTFRIGTPLGLALWRNGRLEHPNESPRLASPSILSLLVAPAETVWIGTSNNGLYSLRRGLLRPEGFEGRSVYSLRTDPDGTLWVGAEDGLFTVTSEGSRRSSPRPMD